MAMKRQLFKFLDRKVLIRSGPAERQGVEMLNGARMTKIDIGRHSPFSHDLGISFALSKRFLMIAKIV